MSAWGHGGIVIILGIGWVLLELPGALAALRDVILRRVLYPGGQMYLPCLARTGPRPATPDEHDVTRIRGSHWPAS